MVTCAECGFLALRDRINRVWIECEEQYRESARVSEAIWQGEDDINEEAYYPECFMGVAYLLYDIHEYREANPLSNSNSAASHEKWRSDSILEIICKDRKCDSFFVWKQGFTPKEHREMLDRKEWKEWQERQRREDKKWRIIELIVLAIIATIVAGGFTILGAFIERGSLFP
jgi:hypothetical protein